MVIAHFHAIEPRHLARVLADVPAEVDEIVRVSVRPMEAESEDRNGIMAHPPQEIKLARPDIHGVMNENGNQYALAALKERRASIDGEMRECERRLRYLRA